MLGKKERAKAFVVVAVIYGTWFATADWSRLFEPYLQHEAQMSMLQTGLLHTIGSAFMLLGTFLVGHLMDTMGTTLTGVATAFITGLFYMINSQMHSFASFFCILPIKMGLCLNQVTEAYLASITEEHERSKVLMRLGVPTALATFIAPVLALKSLGIVSVRTSLICSGVVLIAICLPLILFFLPEPGHVPQSKRPRMIQTSDYQEMLRSKSLQITLLVRFLLEGPYQAYDTLSRRYLVGLMFSNPQDLVFFFAIIGTATILSNTILIKFLQKRFRPEQVLHYTLIVLTIAYVAVSFARHYYQWLLIMLIQIVCLQLAYAELSAQTVNAVDRHHCGKAVGLGYAVQLLAATLTSVVAGYFVARYNFAVWCYISAAVSFIGVLILPYVGGYMNQKMDRLPSANKDY